MTFLPNWFFFFHLLSISNCLVQPSVSTFVRRGKKVDRNELPWMVLISLPTGEVCSGSIVHSQWILTAAHCVIDLKGEIFHNLKVYVGATEYSHNYETNEIQSDGEEYESIVSLLHGEYGEFYDFALVKLKNPLVFSKSIQPVKLPSKHCDLNQEVGAETCKLNTAAGWGSTGGGSVPLISYLRSTSVMLVKQSVCDGYTSSQSSAMLCVRGVSSTLCQGDSGGPMFCNSTIYGVLHRAVTQSGICDLHYPVIYGRICSVLGWIDRIIPIAKLFVSKPENELNSNKCLVGNQTANSANLAGLGPFPDKNIGYMDFQLSHRGSVRWECWEIVRTGVTVSFFVEIPDWGRFDNFELFRINVNQKGAHLKVMVKKIFSLISMTKRRSFSMEMWIESPFGNSDKAKLNIALSTWQFLAFAFDFGDDGHLNLFSPSGSIYASLTLPEMYQKLSSSEIQFEIGEFTFRNAIGKISCAQVHRSALDSKSVSMLPCSCFSESSCDDRFVMGHVDGNYPSKDHLGLYWPLLEQVKIGYTMDEVWKKIKPKTLTSRILDINFFHQVSRPMYFTAKSDQNPVIASYEVEDFNIFEGNGLTISFAFIHPTSLQNFNGRILEIEQILSIGFDNSRGFYTQWLPTTEKIYKKIDTSLNDIATFVYVVYQFDQRKQCISLNDLKMYCWPMEHIANDFQIPSDLNISLSASANSSIYSLSIHKKALDDGALSRIFRYAKQFWPKEYLPSGREKVLKNLETRNASSNYTNNCQLVLLFVSIIIITKGSQIT